MAIFKCKMCSGELEITEGITVVECEYCGTKQTVPNPDNEKKVNLFNRANRLRMASEFDKAASIYENIIAEFPEEAEAYWGLCLCNYGIEYVDDPATAKKIPTCHRASFESLQKDENFELALEYADVVAQKIYRDEAREIDRIMQEILAVSKNEKPYDVFICYKETDEKGERTVDSVLAQDIYDALAAKGLNVFFSRITLEDKLGRQYEPYIFAALNSAKVMLAIGTKYEYYNAVWVKNEWSRFLKLMAKDKSKVLIPCFKDLDAYDMPEKFKNLQAQDMGKIGFVQDLVRGVEKITGNSSNVPTVHVADGPNVEAFLKRGNIALEDSDFDEAKLHFDKALDVNAECAEAYLGLALIDEKVNSVKDFVYKNKLQNKNYQRAKQYADKTLLDKLVTLETITKENIIRLQCKRDCLSKVNNMIFATATHTICIKSDGTVVSVGNDEVYQYDFASWTDITSIGDHLCGILGLKKDGTVVATGSDFPKNIDLSQWVGITSVAGDKIHIAALKSNGKVVTATTGNNKYGECNVTSWRNIIAVAAGLVHTVGLKSDGTVVAVGQNDLGQCDVSSWKNIVAISTKYNHTVGLRNNHTVVAVGENKYGECDVSSWENIVAVFTQQHYTLGLKSDGTVVATGRNDYGQCNVSSWKDIVAISTTGYHTVGLKSDGTVVAVGRNRTDQCNVSSWTDIVAVAAGPHNTVGLKTDGTVVVTGFNGQGQCDVSDWKLFDNFENIEEERKLKFAERKRIEEENRIVEEKRIEEQKTNYRQQNLCQHCGGSFKGLLIKKCSNCGKVKDY